MNKEELKNEVTEIVKPMWHAGLTMHKPSIDNLLNTEDCKVNKKRLMSLIDQLDEPETLSQEWIDKYIEDMGIMGKPFIYADDLKNLLLPKPDKSERTLQNALIDLCTGVNADEWLKKFRNIGYELVEVGLDPLKEFQEMLKEYERLSGLENKIKGLSNLSLDEVVHKLIIGELIEPEKSNKQIYKVNLNKEVIAIDYIEGECAYDFNERLKQQLFENIKLEELD